MLFWRWARRRGYAGISDYYIDAIVSYSFVNISVVDSRLAVILVAKDDCNALS
jgi:hypothetical protein